MKKSVVLAAVAAGIWSFAKAETCVPTNVVVAPLTDAHWTQNAPYNDYSPKGTTSFQNGWEAGCVAIAAAQELYYWQWPWRLGAVHETSHPVLNESNLALRFDGNVPFDWADMQDAYGDGATLKQKHAAAHLVLACQSLVQMQFVSGGGLASKNLPGTMEWFEYAGQVTPRASEANLAALKADFESGSPVQTGINFKGYGGHEVVGLGYATGTNSVGAAKNLIWLNLGWGGGSDGWYDLAEATDGETIIKSVQLGFRPIKSVQIEPVAPVSGNSVTLNWHLPNCYTNKISGFTVATKKLGSATTTWSDDFSTAIGRSNNTNEIRIVNGSLKAWCGTASGMYIWDDVIVPTADSVLTYDVGSSYMSAMSVRFEAKEDGAWQTIQNLAVNSGKEANYYNYGTIISADPVSLASFAGKPIQLRFVVEYTSGGIFSSDDASVKIDNLSISNVKTFADVTSTSLPASARSNAFSGLTTGDTYAFSVTPVMSDGSPAVVQTATTAIGTPAAAPTINAVTMSPNGSNLVKEGFYADIAMGLNTIDVSCSESVTSLEAFISHQSVLPQSKIEVVDNGSGSFSINIDATEVAAKWANQKMILTLKATNATGEAVYKNLELCLQAPPPVAAAVWENDFGANALAEFEGYPVTDWQQTHGENNSSVTIDRNNQGLFVDFTESKGYVTVLVKYSNLSASPSYKRVLFATTANSNHNYDRCGLRLLTDGKVQGLWNNQTVANNDADYGSASTGTVPSAGTLAFVYDKGGSGTSAYVAGSGEALSATALWNNTGLKAGDIYGFAVGGMCRNASASGVEAAKGMTITGLAVFDKVLTVDEMNAYIWPSQLPPVDKDKYAIDPAAVWCKDFKTTTKGDYTLSTTGSTVADDTYGSLLTIGDAAAVIDAPSSEAITVLVKYRTAPAIHSAPVVTFGGQAAVTFDSGICTDTSVDRQLSAYYSFIYGDRKRGIYAVGGTPTLSADGGYLVCARKTNACLAYVGDSLDSMSGGECTEGMQISNSTLKKIGIGGQTELSSNDETMVPFTGFVVEKVVVFNGYYTPDEIRYVENPEDGDTLAIGSGKTWRFAAGETKTYTNIGTLNAGGTIAITNASTLAVGSYKLAEWTTPQAMISGYGHVGALKVDGLPSGLSAELVYGAKAIYLRVWDPTDQASKGTIKVWPYGDSITEGFNAGYTKANYRVLLAQKLSLLGYNVEMVGCYDKIHGNNGIDPSGQDIPDAWKWHSAKHGATAGPTTSAPRRANLCENVDTLCAQAGNPDVVLLLAGANDIVPATGLSAAQVVSSITNIVAHLATNMPDTKIVVGNQINVEYGYNSANYTHVTNMIPNVNKLLKNYVDNLPSELNGRVFLADLNSYVKSGETGVLYGGDHLHPDWLGHDQMAEGWLSVITNQFAATQVFPSATVPVAPAAEELGAAAKDELAAYRQGYKLSRKIDAASNIDIASPYADTGDGITENIGKVGYFVEYVRADNNSHKWVWVDMDAFGSTIDEIGLPTTNHQQVVTRLHVKSNHNGIEDVAADDDSVSGFIEFSPYNYSTPSTSGENYPDGNHSDTYDWNDTLSTTGSYGCMQVHRISPNAAADGVIRGGQVLFAYNNWQSGSSTAEFGIGNFSSHFYRGANDAQTLDYTLTANATKMNADAYSVKTIEIWTKEKEDVYDGPDPVAVWVAGEFDDDRSAHGGLEVSLNGNTTNALGQIVIGSSTTLGATIALPDATHQKMTMLVKYSLPSDGAPAVNSVSASMFSSYDLGARAAQAASSALDGYWYNGSSVQAGTYAFSTPAQTMPQEGYILISTWATDTNPNDHGTAVYSGETLSALSGGEKTGLRFTGSDRYIASVGIGGPTIAGAVPWAGMVIKSVALFDEWVTPSDLAKYTFPEQGAVRPADSDRYAIEPVVSWVNDFKTTEKGDYTLSVSGTTAAKDDTFGGTLTIGDAAAVVDVRNGANGGNLTVLVKYRATPATVNAPVVTFGETLSNSVKIDVGTYTQSARTLAVNRSWNGGNNKWVALNTAASLNEGEGYLLCARKSNDMMVYVGDSLDSMTGGSTAASGDITFSCDLIQAIGIGGPSGLPNADSTWSPFTGFVVEKVVVFNGYYTPDQIRYVENPEDGDTVNIASGATWNFAAGETRTYTNIGTLSSGGTIAITNAATLVEGTYKLAEWTTPQQYTTQCAGYGKVGNLVTDGLAAGLSARLVYGARAIYLRVDDTAKQAARKPLVVWCYGDSITEGYNAQATGANYRILLYQKLEMLGYNVRSTGVYGLSNGYNSVDPAGTPLTDQYKWHSAKHGATAGPSSLSHRSNLSENVDTLAIQAGTPDVALLLIGVNDLPQFTSVEPVFAAWTNVVNRLVGNLPNTKIVVSTILYSDGTRTDIDPKITNINDNYIKPLMASLPEAWQGHVVLADLNSIVKSGQPGIIYSDHLHPDWWGYDQMADGYLEKIVECYPDPDATNFPSQNPIPSAPTADQLGAANKPELADYRAGFTKLCNIRVEKGQDVGNVVYDEMNSAAASNNLEKVGYFVEFVRGDNHAHKWVWVDMDAFGDADLASVGLPQRIYQQAVTKMHVCSNHGAIDNVAADDDSVTGWIEFSPYDYTRNASNSSAPANYGDPFDWNDTLSTSGSYGCMQVFRVMNPSSRDLYERPQLLFAFNNFQSANSNPADFGIGNFAQHFNCNNSYHTEDWTGVGGTLAKMDPDAYSVKTIEIWTKSATPAYVRDNTVRRADGTVYHGNDANRAIITNWEYQINRPVAPPAPNTIDILYVLDKPSREYIENTKNMSLDEFFAKSTAFMNQMLCPTDMDTNFWFRMVGVYPLDVQAQEVSPMLGRSKNSSEPGFELVNEMRNRVGADIVFSVSRNGGGIGGLAYVNSYENIVSGAAAPLGHACGFLEYYNMISWVHEIAHVMSCNHMPPDNIDVNNPRHRQFGVVVHDDNATEAPFDYRTIMTGWYYGGQTYCFSSRNHYYNGVQLSVSNHVDATQVMVELAPYVAQWRPTKVPERPEITFFPQDQAEIPAGVETMVTINYSDPEAEIYWYDATSGEGKSDARLYTGPISVVGGSWKMLYAFAKTNDVEVAESEKTATYFLTGMYGRFDYSQVLDSDGITWSMPLGDSSDFAWDKDTENFCAGESSYRAHVDMESLTNSRPSTCSATAMLTLTEARNLNFRHLDSYTNAMFSVWVDDVPVYYKKGASDTCGEWRKEVIRVESGTHRIEFVFTQTAEDMVDAQTSEGDEHALVDDEKYQRYIASLKAAETSRVWIDGFEWTPTDMIWAGDETTGDGVWTTDITYKPWEGGVSFADDAVVSFPDVAAGSPTVAVQGVVRPSKVNFDGASTAYTFVPQDENAFIYVSNGSSIEFKTNAAIRVPFRLDTAYIRSAAKCTLELGNVFGHGLTGPGVEGSFWGQIGVGSKSTVIMNPGAGRTQTVGDFGKNWSYTDSDLVFTNGTVKVNGAINEGNGLFQYKRIHVRNGAVLELVTTDATGYDVAANNIIEVELGGELRIDAGDRLRRPMKLSGGKLTVSRSGSVHALALYNNPSFTVTADSVLTNGNAAATLGFVGQDATITLQNNATLDCYVPFANGIMDGDSKNVTISGNGTFVQNTLMIQFTNKVTVANGVTFRQNAVTSGMVGKSSWDVNGTLEANAIMQVNALTLASGATLSVKVTDANVSNAAILCDAAPSLAGSIIVNAASDLANGKYVVIAATGLEDGLLARVSSPALAKRATFAVEEGGLFMTVADYTEGAFTDTSYPVPYSWMMEYYPSLRGNPSEYTELQALQPAASAAHSIWECYVLGLDPTNETSKFLTTIRMDGTTPVVEYSPTNTALGNITYVLQGKPALSNGWQDVDFDEPGDTNRFFRVKVTW